MTPERIAELRRSDTPRTATQIELYECLDEIERLNREGVPGQMHEIDKSFYELTVSERDYERVRVDRLEGEVAALKSHRSCELGSDCPCYLSGYDNGLDYDDRSDLYA